MTVKRCDENARKGTGYGMCEAPLDEHGNCPYAASHVPTDEVPARAMGGIVKVRAAGEAAK